MLILDLKPFRSQIKRKRPIDREFQPIECFPLTYDLNGVKSRIDRHLLTRNKNIFVIKIRNETSDIFLIKIKISFSVVS